jgi:predicted aconitase
MRSGGTDKRERILSGEKGGAVKSAMKVMGMMEKNGET